MHYVRDGGHLLLIGPKTAALFAEELGVHLEVNTGADPRYLAHAGTVSPLKGLARAARLDPKAQPFGALRKAAEANSPSSPAASVAVLGRGKIAAMYFGFSEGYLDDRSPTARAFLDDLSRRLFPDRLVEVKGSSDVDVAVRRLGGRLAVNLVNTAGPHADMKTPILESIPSVGPLTITIRTPRKPARITLEPAGNSLPFETRDGKTIVTLPKLDIHAVVVVD